MKISHDFLNANPGTAAFGGGPANLAGTNFATLLQQSRAPGIAIAARTPVVAANQTTQSGSAQKTPADADQHAASSADGSAATADEAAEADANEAAEAAAKPRGPAKPRSRAADDTAPRAARERSAADPARTERAAAAREAAGNDADGTKHDPTTNADAGLPNWIGALMPPAQPTPAAATAAAGRDAGDAGADVSSGEISDAGAAIGASRGRGIVAAGKRGGASDLVEAGRERLADRDAARVGASDTAAANAASATNATKDGNAAPVFGSLLGELRADAAAARREASHAADAKVDAPGAAALNAAPAPALSTPHDAASTASADVRAAVGSPEFPQELGVKLSVLAKDGVQQAELHLNPAEMGPVSVQIVMDGTQARVDFGADVAATRQAIEAGLPELASALRDAGFTLAGGGVSQHAGGRQPQDGERGAREAGTSRIAAGSAGAGAGEPATRVVRTRVSAGGVDVYA